MYCAAEPSVLSLSLQDTMADGGRRRPERRGANGRGATERRSRESERESRESEQVLVGRGRSVSADPTASVLKETAPSARPLGHVTVIGAHLSETPSTAPNDRFGALCKTITECAVAFAKD